MSQSTATEGLDKSEAVLYCLQDSLNSAHSMEICNELNTLLVRAEKLDPKFDEDGPYQYHSSADDFKLIIPEGAIVGTMKSRLQSFDMGHWVHLSTLMDTSPYLRLCGFAQVKKSLRNNCRL